MDTKKRKRGELSRHLLAEITPEEQARTYKQMAIAARIADALAAKGWSKVEFAARMGQQPSVITRWLSGTQNFTIDTLSDIEEMLEVHLLVTDVTYPAGHPLAGQPTENPYTAAPAKPPVPVVEHHYVFVVEAPPVYEHCSDLSTAEAVVLVRTKSRLLINQNPSLN